MHSSRMRTTPLVDRNPQYLMCLRGVCPTPPTPHADPLDADPTSHVTCDACWEANPPPPPWTEGMTDAYENISLPQT